MESPSIAERRGTPGFHQGWPLIYGEIWHSEQRFIVDLPSYKMVILLKMTIEIVDLPSYKMVILLKMTIEIVDLPSYKMVILLKMTIEIVDLPSYKMVDLSIAFCKRLPEGKKMTCWWFGTCFFHILGIIIPTDELMFFRGIETTNQMISKKYTWTIDPDSLWWFNTLAMGK